MISATFDLESENHITVWSDNNEEEITELASTLASILHEKGYSMIESLVFADMFMSLVFNEEKEKGVLN